MSSLASNGPQRPGSGRRIRSFLFTLHRWIGLHLCLFLGLIFVTGTLSLLIPELDMGARPDLYIAPQSQADRTQSVGDIYDQARAQNPEATIRNIAAPTRPWFGYAVEMDIPDTGIRKAWFHPADGTFLGYSRHGRFSLGQIVRGIHEDLFTRHDLPLLLVTSMLWVVLLMVVTGLVSYRRFWRGYFRWPARDAAPRMRQGALHRLMGVWSFPFLAVIALSGLVFFLDVIGINVSWPYTPGTEERAQVLPEGFDGQAVDGFVGVIKEGVPEFKLKAMYFPLSNTGMLEALGTDRAYGEMVGTVLQKYHPGTLALLGDEQVSQATTGHWLTGIGISLHYGTFGGLATQVIWLLFGLISCYLLLSGARIFATRIVTERDGPAATEGRGTLGLIWLGLGIWKWVYVLLPVLVVAWNVKRAFG